MQPFCGSPSEAAPRTGDDSDASRKISLFHQENCSFVCDITVEHLRIKNTLKKWGV
jgi:hypothetical protein